MREITSFIDQDEQHVFSEEFALSLKAGDFTSEPITMYNKKGEDVGNACVVRRGPGPWVWVKEITKLVRLLHKEGQEVLITKGGYGSRQAFKTATTCIKRSFPRTQTEVLKAISNQPEESPVKISQHLFQVMRVYLNES